MLFDVRPMKEWQVERIENAINFPELLSGQSDEKLELDMDKTYLIYFQGDADETEAIELMEKIGITSVFQLAGGIKAWLEEGLPTVFFKTIEPSDAFQLIKENQENSNFIIIDVRDQDERLTHKRIENSINMDFGKEGFLEDLIKLDRNKTYLIYCRSGVQGAKVMGIMQKQDFKHVYNLKGGFNNWTSKRMPTVR